jgi:glycosyltransferase involved in cell wall biosynthesis
MRGRTEVVFLAWTRNAQRAVEIAAALGGEARTFHALGLIRRPAVPVRYAIDAVRTAIYLAARRPRAAVVTNPPIFPALIALVYRRITGASLVLDSHPSGFGLVGDRLSVHMQRVHAWAARRARTTLVSAPRLRDLVTSWGARADVVHEAPPAWTVAPAEPPGPHPRILFPGIFAADEPLAEVIGAARALPGFRVAMTGDIRKCPPDIRGAAPPNVSFLGFLPQDQYVQALADTNVVLSLSSEPSSVMRTACEAVWAGRPLVITDRADLRELFPHAVHVANDARAIADGLAEAIRRHAQLRAAASEQRRAQETRWERQLAVLECRLFGEGAGGAVPAGGERALRASGISARRRDARSAAHAAPSDSTRDAAPGDSARCRGSGPRSAPGASARPP